MFTKYGNSQIKKHPHGVCMECGMPLQSSEKILCKDCLRKEKEEQKEN